MLQHNYRPIARDCIFLQRKDIETLNTRINSKRHLFSTYNEVRLGVPPQSDMRLRTTAEARAAVRRCRPFKRTSDNLEFLAPLSLWPLSDARHFFSKNVGLRLFDIFIKFPGWWWDGSNWFTARAVLKRRKSTIPHVYLLFWYTQQIAISYTCFTCACNATDEVAESRTAEQYSLNCVTCLSFYLSLYNVYLIL